VVSPSELVQSLADKSTRLDAMRRLIGAVNTRDLRAVEVGDAELQALVDGLSDPNPRIRWWCVQLLDHVPDPRAVVAICTVLDDPVPRVRRNAAHALGCLLCKPAWDRSLPSDVLGRLTSMAAADPNAKVRAEARQALACQPARAASTP
jgi:HEAT repeat protein